MSKSPGGVMKEEDYVERLLNLLQIQSCLSPGMQCSINTRAKDFLESMIPDTGKFLREDLDTEKHSEEVVRTLVQSIPSALSDKNDDGMIPIQCITWDYSDAGFNENAIPFIPLLAEEGLKHNVGGEGMRGGLLCGDSDSDCVLQEITCVHLPEESENNRIDTVCLTIIKELRDKNLLFKKDIKDHNLMIKSCNPLSMQRFEYLVDWNPEALAALHDLDGKSTLLQHLIDEARWQGPERFQLALKAVLQHHPLETGILFHKEEGDDSTTLKKAYKCFGGQEIWQNIQNCLEGAHNNSVLDKNPETNMYPFMKLAADYKDSSELDFMYYLLRQNPVVLENANSPHELKTSPQIAGTKRKRL